MLTLWPHDLRGFKGLSLTKGRVLFCLTSDSRLHVRLLFIKAVVNHDVGRSWQVSDGVTLTLSTYSLAEKTSKRCGIDVVSDNTVL